MFKLLKNIFKNKEIDKTKFTDAEILDDLIKNEYSHNILENTREELIRLHHSLGRDIRNEYGLWNRKWTPELKDGVDYSPNHPDAISMTIIRALHTYWSSHPEELTKRKKDV
jgi:hypothetical protein